MMGIQITMAIMLTVTVCGPVAINISGVFKDIGLTYAGFILFDDAKTTPSVLIGLAISFLGAAFLSYEKIRT